MKNVILFGAGDILNKSITYLNHSRINIVAICDNDSNKWGKRCKRYKIISPND